jgi:hypothetical protein
MRATLLRRGGPEVRTHRAHGPAVDAAANARMATPPRAAPEWLALARTASSGSDSVKRARRAASCYLLLSRR